MTPRFLANTPSLGLSRRARCPRAHSSGWQADLLDVLVHERLDALRSEGFEPPLEKEARGRHCLPGGGSPKRRVPHLNCLIFRPPRTIRASLCSTSGLGLRDRCVGKAHLLGDVEYLHSTCQALVRQDLAAGCPLLRFLDLRERIIISTVLLGLVLRCKG